MSQHAQFRDTRFFNFITDKKSNLMPLSFQILSSNLGNILIHFLMLFNKVLLFLIRMLIQTTVAKLL